MNSAASLRAGALAALQQHQPSDKCAATLALQLDAPVDSACTLAPPASLPCRPERPPLVAQLKVAHLSVRTPAGRAQLLHALAHIELNAIDLALDIVWRFAGMPEAFYRDWVRVAQEEAQHFSLLNTHLGTLGYQYGDFAAHTGLWDMAEKTQDDLLARLAIVPRTLEARGLDASPPVRDKLRSAGDLRAADIVSTILRDEIGHVRIGNHWYRWLCQQRQLPPLDTYVAMAKRYRVPPPRAPLNLEARRAAGFDEAELAFLSGKPLTTPAALPDTSHTASLAQ